MTRPDARPPLRSLAAALTLGVLAAAAVAQAPEPFRIFVDADSANEVDDPYAIVRALAEPRFDVVALSSAQWQYSHWSTPHSLEDSHRLNVLLLGLLGMGDLPHPRGGHARLYDWGQDVAQHSAAAYRIIEEARATPEGEKLTVASLGALTNVASALLIAPEIAPMLRVALLGTSYDLERGIWRKRDFNVLNDPHALDVVLDAEGLETLVMPVSVAAQLTFDLEDVERELQDQGPVLDFLYRRWAWDHVDGGRYRRVIWDLALIAALAHPQMATTRRVTTPPENVQREVTLYDDIDADAMRRDFFAVVRARFGTGRP